MKLNHGLHLAYCTNIHRGENWAETFDSLKQYTLAVRDQISPAQPYGIGLRLSDRASHELSDPATISGFRKWLDQQNCYIFTINGFPFGRFHGGHVKENVYRPDWTTHERLAYTNRLFNLLAQLVPRGVEGSVSTLPGSFKEFILHADQTKAIRDNLWQCVEHVARLSNETGRKLHLGLEPEPLGLFETSQETVQFFERLWDEHPRDPHFRDFIGVNYDTCHLAVEFEEPAEALQRLHQAGIKISKLHLSSALKVQPTAAVREALKQFADDTYLHQVIARNDKGQLTRYRDLNVALEARSGAPADEWRIHFHIPLHSPKTELFDHTADHLLGVLDELKLNPALCSHLEMETYTWEVMPPDLKNRSVVDQLVAEYVWTLQRLGERGLANIS